MNVPLGVIPRRVGVVAHSGAGTGRAAVEQALIGVLALLGSTTVVVGADTIEGEVARRAGLAVSTVECPPGSGPTRSTQLALRVLSHGVDAIVAIGGDGTMAAVANALIQAGKSAPALLGVGTGSANVGPLVTALGSDAGVLGWTDLTEEWVDGVSYGVNGTALGVAFNDVVFSNVFFGTADGVRVDLDAQAMLSGHRQLADPHPVCGASTKVRKNGRLVLSGEDMAIAQLLACPVNSPARFLGTAASGFLSWGPYVGCPAVLAAASVVLIRTRLGLEDLLAAEPLRLWHVAFGTSDRVEVTGLIRGAVLVSDGNPGVALAPPDRVELGFLSRVVRVLKQRCPR